MKSCNKKIIIITMIVYTSSFGKYDKDYLSADIRYDEVYNPYSGCVQEFSDRMKAKMYKVLNPDNLDIWIDASTEIINRQGLEDLFRGDLCVFKHPFHKNVGEELEACHKLGYIDDNEKNRIVDLYKSSDMDVDDVSVYACGIIYRNNNTIKFNRLWWSLISQFSFRDQLTFPFALAMMTNLEVNIIDYDIFDNKFFVINTHNKKK